MLVLNQLNIINNKCIKSYKMHILITSKTEHNIINNLKFIAKVQSIIINCISMVKKSFYAVY